MSNKLREVFYPSEETLKQYEKILKFVEENAVKEKRCIACAHYNYDAWVPGYIAYEGDCDLSKCPSFGKMEKECDDWELKDGYQIDISNGGN